MLSQQLQLSLGRPHRLFKMKDRNPGKRIATLLTTNSIKLCRGHLSVCWQQQQETVLPHQIKSESLTTKTRIVLDASSKMKGELNLKHVIHQGPIILPNLCGILMMSRIESKIMNADVEKV